jgi:hypothetical protein
MADLDDVLFELAWLSANPRRAAPHFERSPADIYRCANCGQPERCHFWQCDCGVILSEVDDHGLPSAWPCKRLAGVHACAHRLCPGVLN